MKTQTCQLILALDLEEKSKALDLLDQLANSLTWVKVGLQMFTRYGPQVLEEIAAKDYKIFLDLKLHDIPNTVASAIRSLSSCPVEMLTLHASGGSEMIAAAKQARDDSQSQAKLIAVTILTSFNPELLAQVGITTPIPEQVSRLGTLAIESGADGLVCSPHEISTLRADLGKDPWLITPGIRPAGSEIGDQKRIMTPAEASALGSSFIVVGRPILKAENPQAAALEIQRQLKEPK
jgi:orotidine-5'-phosphate decarboxylase